MKAAPVTTAIWTRKDGSQIAVAEMATDHIRNALAMLKRKGAVSPSTRRFYLECPGPVGEAAQDAFDAEFADITSRPTSEFVDIFEAELKRREASA
jgi:hypothetical protein